MEMPTLPTDNLYKFMALSGVAIMISIAAMLFIRANEVRDLLIQSAQSTDGVRNRVQAFKEWGDGSFTKEEAKSIIQSIEAQNIAAGGILTRSDLMAKSLRSDFWFLYALMSFGSLLAAAGFTLWYVKLQRFQDIIIAKESKKK